MPAKSITKVVPARHGIGPSREGQSRGLARPVLVLAAIAATVIGLAGVWAHHRLEQEVERQVQDELEAVLATAAGGVEAFLTGAERLVEMVAQTDEVRAALENLAARQPSLGRDPRRSKPGTRLGESLASHFATGRFTGYLAVNAEGRVLDSSEGLTRPGEVLPPAVCPVDGARGRSGARTGLPFRALDGSMQFVVLAPVPDSRSFLGLTLKPTGLAAPLLAARVGRSGESYAFDAGGVLISSSRFIDDSTKLVVKRREGVIVTPYPDYRGVPVVGAWTWNAARGFGIVSEIDAAEAFESLRTLERIFGVLLALLTLAGGTTVVGSLLVQRARRRAASAETHARHMGEYVIERRIGGGPMSDVYLARHAVLRRPTALKLLRLQDANHSSLERFEREVRVTASLVHPNTIAIYDYGRSEDGNFFYAMEYLDGMDLERFVSQFGPCPDARTIHLLRQACGSLGEAHARGLIHRDIKPANLFVCRGGAIPDLVKVLDFGLVRIADGETVSGSGVVVGTPLAMAPELFESADNASVRSDIYAIGCVGYTLVAGQPVFEGASLAQLCNAHLSKHPVPPSQRLDRPVDAMLERLLMSCLAKDPRDRPQSIQELETLLARCPAAGGWTTAAAATFWASQNSFVDTGIREKIA